MRKVEINMILNKRFFIASLSVIIAVLFVGIDSANAAARAPARAAPARKSAGAISTVTKTTTAPVATEPVVETVIEEKKSETKSEKKDFMLENKSSNFEVIVSEILDSASDTNSFAEQIRKQRASLAAKDAVSAAESAQKNAAASNSNTCDRDLRKCMQTKCGSDFTKCALDGDTIFGDKLNSCRRDTTCTAEEFNLFVPEIRADRDMNVRLASYENVINCGNQYNACIVNECGKTYNKCLGKPHADAAIQKCATIAKECTEADSGLASRFGTAIGKLRETAEKEIKKDEERMYALRDMMSSACKRLGAMFDERTFDCVYTVNFFAGESQQTPLASRKRYAGDSFVCMQEWFGVNTTTYKENAFRETRAQKAASSAMLGAGVGTAAGLISSGAIGRALKTQQAKKEYDAEKNAAGATTEQSMSAEEQQKQSDFQTAVEQGTTMGTKNADDYQQTKQIVDKLAPNLEEKYTYEQKQKDQEELDKRTKELGDKANSYQEEPEEDDEDLKKMLEQAEVLKNKRK